MMTEKERVIFHCDCNSFYASVELLKHPDLRDRPVAVGGSQDNRHGIILAKNEAAKKYRVQTAETIWSAKRKCPQLILLSPHHQEYIKYSQKINQIYSEYTDRVEPFGIDESWLDMTGSWQLFGKNPLHVANLLRERVENELQLTISVGISFNKVFAKLGSDMKKPNATTEISRENFRQVVWPLPATALLFVGRKAGDLLGEMGIQTIGQLARADVHLLEDVLGKQGRQMHQYANGLEDSPVSRTGEREPVKSVGNGFTFKRDLVGRRDVRAGVGYLAEEVAYRLRQEKQYAGAVQVLIKNPNLKSISRQKPLEYSSNLAKDLIQAVMEILEDNWDFSKPIRMLTITALQLTELPYARQTSLFEDARHTEKNREKQLNLEASLDLIRNKYGKAAVLSGGILHNDIGLERQAKPEEELNGANKEEEREIF